MWTWPLPRPFSWRGRWRLSALAHLVGAGPGAKDGHTLHTRVISLHDQATALRYPGSLGADIDLLFGPQAAGHIARTKHFICVRESNSDRYSISGDLGGEPGNDLTRGELLDALLDEVTHSLIDELQSAVALHAASVGRANKSILIAGPTGAGKTSLAAWFVSRDFEFLSDELVVLPQVGKTALSFPRPLLVRPNSHCLTAMLNRGGRSRTVRTATNMIVWLNQNDTVKKEKRQTALVIFPHFIAGSELKIEPVSPAMTGLKLMECNLNARNVAEHGLRYIAEFARGVPALDLTYGSYEQLDDSVIDIFSKLLLSNDATVAEVNKLTSAFCPPGRTMARQIRLPVVAEAANVPAPACQGSKKLTIGMATYDDYDGVYFTLQAIRMYHPEIADDVEFLVIDNDPQGRCADALKSLGSWIHNYRYVAKKEASGTAIRDFVFQEAAGEFVLCVDCHVLIVPGALKRLIDYFDEHPATDDLLQGPMQYDDLKSFSTHFTPKWRAGMYGAWDTTSAAAESDQPPFEIPMQGLGLFACRCEAWPGFNPAFRGFGGEEGYIHEKFRQRGGRTLCLPFLRWMHRFNRPHGVPYPLCWEDRVRNYFIGFRELGWDTAAIADHFREHLGPDTADRIIEQVQQELASAASSKEPSMDAPANALRP